jgi:Tetratricopeptide repeat/Protein of unknown function (DUF2914)
MTDTTEARQILEAAEHAAAAGDFTSAERLLREAAAVQERTLGADHPDLANTLNNLGVVCERADRPDEAEQFYRRAYAIATSALPVDHPFVATSRKNLEDLCASMGKSFAVVDAPREHDPATTRMSAGSTGQDVVDNDAASSKHDPTYTEPLRLELDTSSAPATRAAASVPIQRREEPAPSRALSLGAVTVVGIAVAIMVIGWIAWPSRSATEPPPTETADTTPRSPTPSPQSTPASPAPTSKPAAAPDRSTPQRSGSSAPAASAAGAPGIVDLGLCKTLTTSGKWKCDPIGSPASPGTISFYTRIASPRATTVQHRWYYGDRLRQSVMLEIQPNGAGYRTYSRYTISADRAGEWRVELRSEDGRLLREERFTVR